MEGQAGGGGYHHKTSALYQPVCTLCEAENTKAEYIGETWDSGYSRRLDHAAAIRNLSSLHLQNTLTASEPQS